jgi:hypothetical protein
MKIILIAAALLCSGEERAVAAVIALVTVRLIVMVRDPKAAAADRESGRPMKRPSGGIGRPKPGSLNTNSIDEVGSKAFRSYLPGRAERTTTRLV